MLFFEIQEKNTKCVDFEYMCVYLIQCLFFISFCVYYKRINNNKIILITIVECVLDATD
jgi:hypothetical protein